MMRKFADKIVMIAEFTLKPDQREAFLEYTAENLKFSRDYPGNLAFDILIDEARPDTVLFHEVWASAEAQQAYMAWRATESGFARLFSFLSAPPKFTAYRSVEA